MQAINVSTFKAECLALLENVSRSGEPLIITKRGTPLAQVVPISAAKEAGWSPFGCMAGTAEELEDIVAPLDIEWDACADS